MTTSPRPLAELDAHGYLAELRTITPHHADVRR